MNLLLTVTLASLAVTGGTTPGNVTSPEAVAEVQRIARVVANAAWWGFNEGDATEALQGAIDSRAETVIVPYMGVPWVVRPLRLRSNQTIRFEPGVVVLAKEGAFRGKGDCLFQADDVSNLTLEGYGAVLRMRKADYQQAPYEAAEWRMTLSLHSCRNVTIRGLTFEDSGGDGIYVGQNNPDQPYCENIIIQDVTCRGHHRQGISVITARHLRIENCRMEDTEGTAPEAGIDFEPNRPTEFIDDCVVRGCTFSGNAGAGILVYLKNLAKESAPVSLRFEDCLIQGGKDVGIGVGAITDNGPAGLILFQNCVVESPAGGGLYVYDKSAGAVQVRFDNCHWTDVDKRAVREDGRLENRGAPILLNLYRPELVEDFGGIGFTDCRVHGALQGPVLVGESESEHHGMRDITGTITVDDPVGAKADFQCAAEEIALTISAAETP